MSEKISALIISKSSLKKNGVAMPHQSYYIRRSIKDYYIKFGESKISREELERALSQQESLLPTLYLEVEFREGMLDASQDNPFTQSRIGEYVIIKKIL